MKLLSKIHLKFINNDERTIKAYINILASFVFKGGSIAINLAFVPIMIGYLNPLRYGIWLTLSSILGWLSFFDIGIGNGLRNKFTESVAKNDMLAAKVYVSTAYFIVTAIMITVLMVFLIINPLLNWAVILNTPSEMSNELTTLVLFVVAFFCLQFILKLIGVILVADQLPAYNDLITFLSNILSLAIILIIKQIGDGSLLQVGIALSCTQVLVLSVASILLFRTKYKQYLPSWKYFYIKNAGSLFSIGIKFFIIQISSVVLFTSTNILITQLMDPSAVTSYNIGYKYFGIVTMAFSIIMSPFWTGFADAYFRNDLMWINTTLKKMIKMWLLFAFGTLLMLLIAPFVYKYWIGSSIQITWTLSFLIAVSVILNIGIMPFVYLLNGIGKINLQLYLSVFSILFNIPCAIFMVKVLSFGVEGIIFASVLSILPFSLLMPFQTYQLLKGKKSKLWN